MSGSDFLLPQADKQFCHEYCAFINAQLNRQQHEDLADAFLAEYPLPQGCGYPRGWDVNEDERKKAAYRFFNLTKELLPIARPIDQAGSPSILFSKRLKSTFYYIAMGFVASMVARYLGVYAAPSIHIAGIAGAQYGNEMMVRDVRSTGITDNDYLYITGGAAADESVDIPVLEVAHSVSVPSMFYKGRHFDNTTGQLFELYVTDDAMDEECALDMYRKGGDDSTLVRRDWYDCRFPRQNYIQKFCCNTGHAFKDFLSGSGQTVTGIYLEKLLEAALNGVRDNKSPRSICLSRNGSNLCLSWATYDTDKATAAEADDIVRHSLGCAQSGGSAEFKTETRDGGLLFVCVSNRADGCKNYIRND